MSKKLFLVFVALISCLYFFLRFYNFNTLIGFRLDQGIHLSETKLMFDSKKISLVGPMVTSKSFEGRNFFIGANYYYVLGVIGLISHWDPVLITSFFIVFEFIFYLFFIFFLKRKFSDFWSLLIFFFIAISPYLVAHSRFFWNPHLLIPLSILNLYFLDKFISKKKFKYLFISAFLWGFAFACHYSSIFWIFIFLFVFVKSHQLLKLKSYFLVFLGFILGDLPFFVFEIRHSFYNIKTFVYVFTHSSQSSDLTSHYFIFSLLIFGLFIILFSLSQIKNKLKSSFTLICILIFIYLLQLKLCNYYSPLGAIDGWSYPDQQLVTNLIVKNGCPKNFNVAATMQGDTRFYDMRYLLMLKNCLPMSVEDYPKAQKLFVVAPISKPIETETVWEITSFKPFKIIEKITINNKLIFYELGKSDQIQ